MSMAGVDDVSRLAGDFVEVELQLLGVGSRLASPKYVADPWTYEIVLKSLQLITGKQL